LEIEAYEVWVDWQIHSWCITYSCSFGQSSSFETFTNPVIPGDHPDCTLTKIGNDFIQPVRHSIQHRLFTIQQTLFTGKLLHNRFLLHGQITAMRLRADVGAVRWFVIVISTWDFYSNPIPCILLPPVIRKDRGGSPTLMNTPSGVPGLGYDNSIFIDDDSTWYLLLKNGQVNNWIVQLGNDGQPNGGNL